MGRWLWDIIVRVTTLRCQGCDVCVMMFHFMFQLCLCAPLPEPSANEHQVKEVSVRGILRTFWNFKSGPSKRQGQIGFGRWISNQVGYGVILYSGIAFHSCRDQSDEADIKPAAFLHANANDDYLLKALSWKDTKIQFEYSRSDRSWNVLKLGWRIGGDSWSGGRERPHGQFEAINWEIMSVYVSAEVRAQNTVEAWTHLALWELNWVATDQKVHGHLWWQKRLF